MSSSFADLGVPADLSAILNKRGITSPFPIQAAALPDALAGLDICGRAPTGSGKTLAFGIPLVMGIGKAAPRQPRGLVLVPTRELAAQVERELAPLAAARKRSVTSVYGGTGYEGQRRALRRGVDILVACPGRLEDLIERRDVSLKDVNIVVLDEADRMADMGFLPAVRRLLDAVRQDRQTMLFSATLDGDVDVVIRKYQNNPSRHDVAPVETEMADVEHVFWQAERPQRVQLTAGLLARHDRAIVFCRTKHGADRLVHQLSASGIDAVAIHGNRSQGQRERALAAFSSGRAQALIATDVAARGIHVDDVPCVVHFDPPADHKDYVHRSGRTGRAGNTGTVVSLVGNDQRSAVRHMQRALGLPQELSSPDVEVRHMAPVAPTTHAPRPAANRFGRPSAPNGARRRGPGGQGGYGGNGGKGGQGGYGAKKGQGQRQGGQQQRRNAG